MLFKIEHRHKKGQNTDQLIIEHRAERRCFDFFGSERGLYATKLVPTAKISYGLALVDWRLPYQGTFVRRDTAAARFVVVVLRDF
jgi:hypothetical protein